MKQMCQTDRGTFVVEMSLEEWRAFSRLARAVGDEQAFSLRGEFTEDTGDLTSVLAVIQRWYKLKFDINSLRAQLIKLDNLLKGEQTDVTP